MTELGQSDGCTGFQFLEGLFDGVRDCCVVHDAGGSDGMLLDCLQGVLPGWAWAPAALCVAVMVFFRPLYHRIKPALDQWRRRGQDGRH